MGYNTVVLILNDDLTSVQKNAQKFCDGLAQEAGSALNRGPSPMDFFHQHGVIETHHADDTSVILVGGNSATVLGFVPGFRHNEVPNQIRALEQILTKYGYGIRRQPLRTLRSELAYAKRELDRVTRRVPRDGTPYDEYRAWQHEVKHLQGIHDHLVEMVSKAELAKYKSKNKA